MSDEKWTAGPWRLETVPTNNGQGSCHKIGPFPSLGVYSETWACVYADSMRIGIDYGHSKVGDELLANAHLIKASPRLYAALRDVLPYAEACIGPTWRATPPHDSVIAEARAALAAARGEQA